MVKWILRQQKTKLNEKDKNKSEKNMVKGDFKEQELENVDEDGPKWREYSIFLYRINGHGIDCKDWRKFHNSQFS